MIWSLDLKRTKNICHKSKIARKTTTMKTKQCYWSLPVERTKRQAADWEEVFANHISTKDWLVSRIYKELSKPTNKKTIWFFKWTKIWTATTPKKKKMANKHIKRCLTSLVIRERHINNTMTFQSTPIRMAKIKNKKQTISSADEDGKQLKLWCNAGGSTKYRHFGKQFSSFWLSQMYSYHGTQQF